MNDSLSSSRKLSVILAADAAGYTRLMAADEAATVAALNEARDAFRDSIEAHGGRVVDTAGDSILAEFTSPIESVRAATEIQQVLAQWNAAKPAERRMPFRIGINLGDVIEDGGALYGDGVNVASRLEELSEPGGICISGTVFDQIEGKLPLTFTSDGEQQVRNIPKPVRVYRLPGGVPTATTSKAKRRIVAGVACAIVFAAVAAWHIQRSSDKSPEQSALATLPLPSGPAIAVLPFENLSKDPAQEYFADGLAEDIITRLSRFSEIKVIGRNSSFRYKGKVADVREIGRELGVAYVLEGSVRRTPDAIRITVQLLETEKGTHLWAEDYNLPAKAKKVFELQDAVTNRIAATLADASGVIARAQFPAVAGKPSESLSSYECLLRARSYNDSYTTETHLPARACLEAVVEREPNNVEALAWLSIVYADEYSGPYNPRPEKYDAIQRSLQTAERAVLLEPNHQLARLSLANAHFFAHNLEKFIAEGRAAARLNPNNVTVVGMVGFYLVCAGYDDEGIQLLDRAIALNAFHPNWYHFAYFHYQFRQREYEKALQTLNKINLPDWVPTQTFFVATYSRLGRNAEMKQAAAQVKRLNPTYSIKTLERESHIFNMPESHVGELAKDLRKAGIPQKN